MKILEARPCLTRVEVKSLTETWRNADLERVLQVAPGCMHVQRHCRVWLLDVTAETLEPLEEVKETTPLYPVFVADMFMAMCTRSRGDNLRWQSASSNSFCCRSVFMWDTA